jgi:tetratricopeptide (TPR) repeat protein
VSSPTANRQTLIGLVSLIVLGALGAYFYSQTPAPLPPVADDHTGWHATIGAAIADASRPGIRVIVITRAGWSSFEASAYEHPTVAKLIEPLSRARVDLMTDTPILKGWGVEIAPTLVIANQRGDIITSIKGPRDVSVIRRAIERSIEFPFTPAELAKRTDTSSHVRYVEVLIEEGQFDTAVAQAKRYFTADSSAEAVRGRYLYIYATAELASSEGPSKLAEAEKLAREFLAAYPSSPDASAVNWVLVVVELQTKRAKQAENRIIALASADSGSPFARQAILAYSMEYLARGEEKIAAADAFLTRWIEDSSPWTDDFLMARANLRFADPRSIPMGLDDLKRVAGGAGVMATEAQDRLVQIGGSQGGEAFLPQIILAFQDLVRLPNENGGARFRLARLYAASDSLDRAKEEARAVAAGTGPYADDALLFLGAVALEMDKVPADALVRFDEILTKYADRECFWPAKFGRARALFFSGDVARALPAMDELLKYFAQRRHLPEAFMIVLPNPAPPQILFAQIQDYRNKLKAIEKEEKGEAAFRLLLDGVLASSKGDTVAGEKALTQLSEQYPASSLADDALIELAKIAVHDGQMDRAQQYCQKIVTAYRGSDQFEAANGFLEALKQAGR